MIIDRKTWIAALVLSGLLLGGVAIGVALDRFWLGATRVWPPPPPGPGGPDQVVQQLARQLHLDAGQQAKLRAILEEGARAGRTALDELRPKLRAVHQRVEQRIQAMLRPAQKHLYEETKGQMKQGAPPPGFAPPGPPPGFAPPPGAPPPGFAPPGRPPGFAPPPGAPPPGRT